MEIRSTEEARQNIERFATAYIEKMLEKKALDEEIKELKDEFKEEGVPVGVVVSVINKLKSDKKKTDSEKFETNTIQDWLETNPNVDTLVSQLASK